MPNQVGCLPFFPVMPHNHSSPGQGGQLNETSWASSLKYVYFYCYAVDTLQFANDTEKSTNDTSGILLKEITLTSFSDNTLYYFPGSNILRIKFDLKTSNPSYQATAGVYLNGSLKGSLQTSTSTTYITKSQDIDLGYININDKIQIWGLIADPSAYCYIQNFRLYFSTIIYFFKNVSFISLPQVKPAYNGSYNPYVFSNTLT